MTGPSSTHSPCAACVHNAPTMIVLRIRLPAGADGGAAQREKPSRQSDLREHRHLVRLSNELRHTTGDDDNTQHNCQYPDTSSRCLCRLLNSH